MLLLFGNNAEVFIESLTVEDSKWIENLKPNMFLLIPV